MGNYFIKVLHEEPMDKMSLDSIKGGDTCTCNSLRNLSATATALR